ncbi:hypothetical protein [Paenibacillus terrae]|uniref:DNA-binding protein n=1 Tax=Paenibacillus terrae TaxID=159743 RepID=A0A0D7WVP9_9BACL|nr:hypothetical protein [Paenibacillus terrae]KJD42793.1 DNA-binding protein [Paenibacillus terrae]
MFDKLILDSITGLESLAEMLRAAYSFEEWDAMINIADKLYSSVKDLYEENQVRQAKGQPKIGTDLKRNVAYYFGFSMMSKGIALQKMGRYAESRKCIEKYSELGWIKGLNKEGQKEVIYYKMLAKANTYVLDLLDGNTSVLAEYVEFIRNSEEKELLPSIITILQSALTYNYNVDWVLDEFREKLDALDREYYDTNVSIRYYIDHLYLIALYYFKTGDIVNAINITIKALGTSDKLRDDSGFKKLNALFVSFKQRATREQTEEYDALNKNILERVLQNEKGVLYDGSSIVSAR